MKLLSPLVMTMADERCVGIASNLNLVRFNWRAPVDASIEPNLY